MNKERDIGLSKCRKHIIQEKVVCSIGLERRLNGHTVEYDPWAESKDPGLLGFAGYKAGMTHVIVQEATKGKRMEDVSVPVTVLECPPMRIASIRLLHKKGYGTDVAKEILVSNEKDLAKKIKVPKTLKQEIDKVNPEEYDDIRVNVFTQPKLTGIGKKKPEIFEVALGGSNKDKLEFAKTHIGKEITVSDIFKEGEQLDIIAVTKGKGFQGPVKRFGVKIRARKSEKTKRGPGSLGGWSGQAHFMYRVAHAGQMGFHNRTEYNKWLLKIGTKPAEINPSGGFVRYGLVKNQYILLKGSIPGSVKRLIRMKKATRPDKNTSNQAPAIEYVSLESRQGL